MVMYAPTPKASNGTLMFEFSDDKTRDQWGYLLKPNKVFCEYYDAELAKAVKVEMPWHALSALMPEEFGAAYEAAKAKAKENA